MIVSLTDSVLTDTENVSNSVQDNLNKMQDFQNRLFVNISSIRQRLQYTQKQSARVRHLSYMQEIDMYREKRIISCSNIIPDLQLSPSKVVLCENITYYKLDHNFKFE